MTSPQDTATKARDHAERLGDKSEQDLIRKQTKERVAEKPCGKQTASIAEVPAVLDVKQKYFQRKPGLPPKSEQPGFAAAVTQLLPVEFFPFCKNRTQQPYNHPMCSRPLNVPKRQQTHHTSKIGSPAVAPVCNGSRPATRRPPATGSGFF